MAEGQSRLNPDSFPVASETLTVVTVPAMCPREASPCDFPCDTSMSVNERDSGLVDLECGESRLDAEGAIRERGVELAEGMEAHFLRSRSWAAEILEVDHPELDGVGLDRDAYIARFEVTMRETPGMTIRQPFAKSTRQPVFGFGGTRQNAIEIFVAYFFENEQALHRQAEASFFQEGERARRPLRQQAACLTGMECACRGAAAQSVAEGPPEATGRDAFDQDEPFVVL